MEAQKCPVHMPFTACPKCTAFISVGFFNPDRLKEALGTKPAAGVAMLISEHGQQHSLPLYKIGGDVESVRLQLHADIDAVLDGMIEAGVFEGMPEEFQFERKVETVLRVYASSTHPDLDGTRNQLWKAVQEFRRLTTLATPPTHIRCSPAGFHAITLHFPIHKPAEITDVFQQVQHFNDFTIMGMIPIIDSGIDNHILFELSDRT